MGLNLLLAISQRNAGKTATAVKTLEQIFSVMPANPEILFFLSLFYYETSQTEKLIDLLKEVIPADNLSVLTIELLVNAWIKKGNYTLAEGILQKAMEAEIIEPYIQADIRMLLANVAKISGRVAESAAYTSKTKKQFPSYENLDERLGIKISKTAKTIETTTVKTIRRLDESAPVRAEVKTTMVTPPDTVG